MQITKQIAIISLSALLLTSCGITNSKVYDGHRVHVSIQKADAERDRPNPVAGLLLVSSRSPITRYKDILMGAAAQESGCVPMEDTFTFIGSMNVVASVELDCGDTGRYTNGSRSL